MVGKLKELARTGGEVPLVATIRDSATQIWLAGLGAFAKAQKEGTKIFDALVAEGEAVQAQAKKAAGDAYAEVKAKATKSIDQLSWDNLERVFEERVSRALNALSVPTKKDLDTLAQRVAELTTVTRELMETMEKPAARVRHERSHEAATHS
jgi:poly(hydroxyalkanoate) granule-associated protein